MYITYEEYVALNDVIEERHFLALAFDACRVMDIHTTGIDNVKKLQKYFPVDLYDAQAVKHCAAKLIGLLYQIQQAEASVHLMRGAEQTEQGMRGRVIASVTAGNESITYSTGTNTFATAVDAAVMDKAARDKLLSDTVRECLSGVKDCNGVNLLYMGRYPGRRTC
jgi:hypothetical protein